jgi:hypothetical protein
MLGPGKIFYFRGKSTMFHLVNLKSFNGNYVQAINGGGSELTAKGPWPKLWETFWIVPVGKNQPAKLVHGMKVTIQTPSGCFLQAENGGGGKVNCRGPWGKEWETFTIHIPSDKQGSDITTGSTFGLVSHNGKFVKAVNGGGNEVTADGVTFDDDAAFTVEFPEQSPILVNFMTADNIHYLQASNGGGSELTARGPWPKQWETFELLSTEPNVPAEFKNGARVFLRTESGHYVKAVNGGGSGVDAAGIKCSNAEKFVLEIEVVKNPPIFKPKKQKGNAPFHIDPPTIANHLDDFGKVVIIPAKGKKTKLRTFGGRYLKANNGGGGIVTAVESTPGDYEIFWANAETLPKTNTPIDSRYNALGGEKGALGKPKTTIRSWANGRLMFQHFDNGTIYWYSHGTYVIKKGEIYTKLIEIGGIDSELGLPVSEEQTYTDTKQNIIKFQLFEKGLIYKSKDTLSAALYDGRYYPRIPYKLTLEKIICNEESDGLGSDDFWLSYVVGTSRDLAASKKNRLRNTDFDTDEAKIVNHILYQGDLPDSISVSLLGLEVDGTDDARDVLNRFEIETEKFDKSFGYSYNDINNIIKVASLTGAIGGGVIGSIVGVGGVVFFFEINGVIVYSTVLSESMGGAVVGGVIGVVIGALVGIVIAAISDFLPPDLLVADKVYFSGANLSRYVDKHSLPLPWDTFVPDNKSENKLKVSGTYYRDTNGDLMEHRQYESFEEDSRYTLVFRHCIG